MAFAGNQHHIALSGERERGAYGFAAVGDAESPGPGGVGKTGFHLGYDFSGFLVAGIVGCEHELLAACGSFSRHQGTFAAVAVATGAHHGDDGALRAHHIAYGVEHVYERIGRMGIVHDSSHAVGAVDGLETSGHGHKAAHVDEHCFAVPPQQTAGTVNGREIVGVETAGEEHLHLMAVERHEGAIETALDHAACEIGHSTQRICVAACRGVLEHHLAIAVVEVGESERRAGQPVEKRFLGGKISVDRLVIIKMVAGEIGEHASGEMQSGYTVLVGGVGAYLHCGHRASGHHHAVQKLVER